MGMIGQRRSWHGYGDGYGYGYGDGYGYGYGDGDGYGYGYGTGTGDGYGDGDGYGYGYGYGDAGLVDVDPLERLLISADLLTERGACKNGIEDFSKVFPEGAHYPRDLGKALRAGLAVHWIVAGLGILIPDEEHLDEQV